MKNSTKVKGGIYISVMAAVQRYESYQHRSWAPRKQYEQISQRYAARRRKYESGKTAYSPRTRRRQHRSYNSAKFFLPLFLYSIVSKFLNLLMYEIMLRASLSLNIR